MTAAIQRADVALRERLMAAIERMLPWYDPVLEARRDARTERIRQRSIRTRKFAERRLASYRDVAVKR